MVKEDFLRARELLDRTYSILFERNRCEQLVIDASSEIAEGFPDNRVKKGDMFYGQIGLFEIGGKTWAIERGESQGDYPADPYSGDLLALEFNSRRQGDDRIEEIVRVIEETKNFSNSMLVALASGELATVRANRFSNPLLKLLQHRMKEFSESRPESDQRLYLVSELVHPEIRNIRYKPEFAPF